MEAQEANAIHLPPRPGLLGAQHNFLFSFPSSPSRFACPAIAIGDFELVIYVTFGSQ